MTFSLSELSSLSSILSNISSAIIAIVSIYASLSYSRWRREEGIRRRASIAQSCIDHMERFRSRLERLIEAQNDMDLKEWKKEFYEAFDTQFTPAAVEAYTLANETITKQFSIMEAALHQIPLIRHNPGKKEDHTVEVMTEESQEKMRSMWEVLLFQWKELKEILSKEALIRS